MTVQELIERLQNLPPERINSSVYLPDCEGDVLVLEKVIDHPPTKGSQLGYITLE